VAHRGRRLLGRIDQPRCRQHPCPSVDGDARAGEPEPAGRDEPAPLRRILSGCIWLVPLTARQDAPAPRPGHLPLGDGRLLRIAIFLTLALKLCPCPPSLSS